MLDKWDNRFLEMAKFVSAWSKDPSTKTGAVIIRPNRSVVSVGFNGLAQKVHDDPERYNNRDIKLKIIRHCEENAADFARESLEGYTLYTWPFMSCAHCAGQMIQKGIKRVVAPYSDNERWVESFKLASQQFLEAGVEIVLDGGPIGGYLNCY